HAQNHCENWGLLQLVAMSTEQQLVDWLVGEWASGCSNSGVIKSNGVVRGINRLGIRGTGNDRSDADSSARENSSIDGRSGILTRGRFCCSPSSVSWVSMRSQPSQLT